MTISPHDKTRWRILHTPNDLRHRASIRIEGTPDGAEPAAFDYIEIR